MGMSTDPQSVRDPDVADDVSFDVDVDVDEDELDESLDPELLPPLVEVSADVEDFSSAARLPPAVGLVEPAALERDAHRGEHLAHRHHGASGRMRGLGERRVVEGLLHLDRLAGVDELVDVRGHRT
jgi:hypothetical protein